MRRQKGIKGQDLSFQVDQPELQIPAPPPSAIAAKIPSANGWSPKCFELAMCVLCIVDPLSETSVG